MSERSSSGRAGPRKPTNAPPNPPVIQFDFHLTDANVQQAIRDRAMRLAENVGETTGAAVSDALSIALREGMSIQETAKLIDQVAFGLSASQRATTIARTECLPGDTLIDAGRITAVYRRWYDGILIDITTRSGRTLSGTPNHPVLTSTGWCALGALAEGDNLLCNAGSIEAARPTRNQHIENEPTMIAQIFDALATIVIPERERTTQPDFHGDGCEGEVDILRSDSVLLLGTFAPIDERAIDGLLSPTDVALVLLATERAPFRRDVAVDQAPGLAHRADRNIRITEDARDQSFTDTELLGERARRCIRLIRGDDGRSWNVIAEAMAAMALPEIVGAGRFPVAMNASAADDGKHLLGAPMFDAGDPIRTPSAAIECDDVLDVRIRPWSGHVYNLTTVDGYFSARGIYTSNTIGALNQGQFMAAAESGQIDGKEWLTQGDSRVRPTHTGCEAEGVIPIGDTFSNGCDYPGDPQGEPEEVINCRCSLLYYNSALEGS